MKLLKTIGQKNPKVKYVLRKAARAVVFDKDGRIALLHVSKENYHKLPGGGAKKDEDMKEALKREYLEEIGCSIFIVGELGMIREYRDKLNRLQDSYCYLAEVKGEKGKPSFTEKEKGLGFKLLWVDTDRAIKLLKNDKPLSYQGKFIQVRDLEFLKQAKGTKDGRQKGN